MARPRSAEVAPQPAPATRSARQALKEKTNTTRTSIKPVLDKAGLQDFVKDSRVVRPTKKAKAVSSDDQFVMAGGLGSGTSDIVEAASPVLAVSETVPEAQTRGATILPTTIAARSARRPPRMTRKPVRLDVNHQVLEVVKDRMAATAREVVPTGNDAEDAEESAIEVVSRAGQIEPDEPELSELSISASPEATDPGIATRRTSLAQPGSIQRLRATPAHEASILALKNFQRRPRQPSMLAMVQQRAQGARPSILNAAPVDDSTGLDSEFDEDIEDDFSPDAEGTPLHVGKVRRSLPVSTSKRQTTGMPIAPSPTATGSLAKRRSTGNDANRSAKRRRSERSPSDVQVIDSSMESAAIGDDAPDTDIVDDAIPSTDAHDQALLRDSFHVQDQRSPDSTMAEPISSSPVPPSQAAIYADPLTQASPPPQRKTRTRAARPPTMSTATLQSLLPKRRRREPLQPRDRNTVYDLASSEVEHDISDDENANTSPAEDEDEDEDELASNRTRRSRRPTTKARATSKTSKPLPSRKTKASAKKPAPATKADAARKTYTRRSNTSSNHNHPNNDKENEHNANHDGDEDENDEDEDNGVEMSMHDASLTTELGAARAKFAEVDDWEMEFESVSVSEDGSY